jgi:uncharacterized protein (TIGR02118 family)
VLKLISLCKRLPEIKHEQYVERLLHGHAPLAIAHQPTTRRYVVHFAEGRPDGGPELDAFTALFFDELDDYRSRLYDSPEGEAAIRQDAARFLDHADVYATSERVHKDETPACALGERTPGVKWICPLKRRPEMAHSEFAEYWQGAHVPLVLKHQPALTRYATNLVDTKLSEGGDDWDGFAEFHFASEKASQRPFDSAEGERRVNESLERFALQRLVYPVGEYVLK